MKRHRLADTLRFARRRTQTRGFTLVELLVVITIIAMLVGLLIPAIQAARNSARRSECVNNQKNLATAVLNYVTSKDKFPPAFSLQPNSPPMNPPAVGWVPPILPMIEQNDLYRAFQNNTWNTVPNAEVSVLICPSANPTGSPAPLSYVVNSGAQDQYMASMQPMDFQENGVFFDEFTPKNPAIPPMNRPRPTPPIDLTYLTSHDGASRTIMLSENLDALDWISVATASANAPLQPGFASSALCWWNGIVWRQPTTADPAQWGRALDPTGQLLNRESTSATKTDDLNARPYSNHSGGFVVAYCDGHVDFMNEDIEYRVYCLLMSPDSNNARYTRPPAQVGTPVVYPSGWRQGGTGPLVPLTDSDF